MDNTFVSPWDIPVMITILREIIKILYEKMLNAIYLYWFHTDTSEKNKSLTGHSNEPLSYLLSSKIFLVSGSPFLEMILRFHMFHFSYFFQETPVFVVGLPCCRANAKFACIKFISKFCFKTKRLYKNFLKILQNCVAKKNGKADGRKGKDSLRFLTPA